jgi:hypothetical protein
VSQPMTAAAASVPGAAAGEGVEVRLEDLRREYGAVLALDGLT